MNILSEKHPAIFIKFCDGKFVVHKTSSRFSAIAIDQCHEQNNAIVKDSAGGTIALMTNPDALRCRMVADPEVARMVTKLESLQTNTHIDKHKHHEQHEAVQFTFLEVKSLVGVIEEMGNTFMEQNEDLLILDTRDIMDISVGEAL